MQARWTYTRGDASDKGDWPIAIGRFEGYRLLYRSNLNAIIAGM